MTLSNTIWKPRVGAMGLLAIAAVVSGCGTATAIVPDAEGVEKISAIGMGCNKPYKLTQDCSGLSGAKRRVTLSDVEFKIAGTENGQIVLMMNAKPNSDAWAGRSAESANVAYEVTKKYLIGEGVNITKVEPVSSGSVLAGYVITTDADSYALLSKHTVDD